MCNFPKTLGIALVTGLILSGCANKEEPSGEQIVVSTASQPTPIPTPTPAPPVLITNAPASGFDINKVPVANPELGKFPYFGLIEGYRQGKFNNKDVDFDRYGGPYYLTVVEKKALQVKAALLPAEEMKKELDAKGHVALHSNFDFDKADIKAESQPIIEQIVKLLKNNPRLNLTVEGHTDNVGTPVYNQRLSEARAKSVVAALTAQAIEARRIKAAGYGQDKPIADNSTDDGRAKNRRVELVKMG